MNSLQKQFRRFNMYGSAITLRDKDLVPEKERFTKVKFQKCIEQMNDPTILDTYLYSSTKGFTTRKP